MRKRDRKALERYARVVADRLELRDWTVAVDLETPGSDDDWHAYSDCTMGRKHVRVAITPACRDWPLEELRQTVAHELVHAHFAVPWEMVRRDLHGLLLQTAYDVFADGFRRTLEYGVDAVADALAKHLPLIKWPTDAD